MREFKRVLSLLIESTDLVGRVIGTLARTPALYIVAALRAKSIVVSLNHREEMLVPRGQQAG